MSSLPLYFIYAMIKYSLTFANNQGCVSCAEEKISFFGHHMATSVQILCI